MKLSVIIPAYNESKRIGPTLININEYLSRQAYEWEILVVNNNSNDDTVAVVQRHQQIIGHLHLIDEHKAGKGYAVTRGMLEATGDIRLFTDADNATTIDHVERMLPYVSQGYDVVIGSIAIPGAKIAQGGGEPLWRVVFGKLGNLWIQFWAVPGIHDTQRGFKMFTVRAAQAIFSKLTIFGWGFDIEVLALARKFGYKIKEVPITWNNDPHSNVSIWAYPGVLLETLKVRWNLLTGAYH